MKRPHLPRIRSFRIRIALLSTLISAMVLLVCGAWTWEMVRLDSLRRMDQSIRDLSERHLSMSRLPGYWQRAAESLEFVLGDLRSDPFIMLVTGREGELLYVSDNWPEELPPDTFPTREEAGFTDDQVPAIRPPGPLPIRIQAFFRSGPLNNMPFPPVDWRIGIMSNPEVTFVLGLNLAPHIHEMERLRRMFLMAIPAALLLIALGGWLLARRALRPVQALTEMAEGITAQGLDQRIAPTQEDIEFERLITVFNDMLTRLEGSFQQAVRFSADAAHELKTPLTILQGELAQAVQGAIPGSENQQMLSHLLEEVQRLKSITRKLMLLSLADSGQLKPRLEPVNLSEVMEAATDDIDILAPRLRLKVSVGDDLWIMADTDLIRQVVQNLISNCIKYNTPDGLVTITLARTADQIRLAVGNSGPGIPQEDRERVFERFYRADKAHNRRVDGTGLGLSLAREIVRAHGGELVLAEAREGWTVFVAAFPAIDAEKPCLS